MSRPAETVESEDTDTISEEELEREIHGYDSDNPVLWETATVDDKACVKTEITEVARNVTEDGPDTLKIHANVPYGSECETHESCKAWEVDWPYEWDEKDFIVALAESRNYGKETLDSLEGENVAISRNEAEDTWAMYYKNISDDRHEETETNDTGMVRLIFTPVQFCFAASSMYLVMHGLLGVSQATSLLMSLPLALLFIDEFQKHHT